MKTPAWARAILWLVAPRDRVDEVLGDLEEAYTSHLHRRGRLLATLLTWAETFDMAFVLLRGRFSRTRRPAQATSQSPVGPSVRGAGVSLLDFKLGFRMLLKYPGLSIVAGLAISFAIAVGAATIEFFSDFLYPSIPLDEGDRIVSIWNQDLSDGGADPRALHDFVLWRQEAKSVEELGAFRSFRRNLITEGGLVGPVFGTEMTAGAFGLARVPPILGRPLGETDERPDSPNVVVIGYGIWQSFFEGDTQVVGRTIRLGSDPATVVGVMPEGFEYPRDHEVWTPLQLDILDYPLGQSPSISVVGRLAPGVGLEEAQAEFSAIGTWRARDFPETHEHLRPSLIRFGHSPGNAGNWLLNGFYFGMFVFFAMLMVLVCANVSLLLFSRTAAREGEILVRTALGASRKRIVVQLFVEALVLGTVSAVLGLWVGQLALEQVVSTLREMEHGTVPFWFGTRLSPKTVTATLIFTVLASGTAGAVPAFKATGRQIQSGLQKAGAGGGGLAFGRLWTSVIVTQVALTVAFIPVPILLGYQTAEIQAADMGFQAEEYLSVLVIHDRDSSLPFSEPGAALMTPGDDGLFMELKGRLAQEHGVSGVALTTDVPGDSHALRRIEVEGSSSPHGSELGHTVATASVDRDFFAALRTPILSGRNFGAADLEPGQHVAIVNEDFARFVLEDQNPVGRRFTYAHRNRNPEEDPGPWYEIVGVVRQVAMQTDPDLQSGAGVYHPLVVEDLPLSQVNLVMRIGPNPTEFSRRLHEVSKEVDPALMLFDIRPMDQGAWQTELLYRAWFGLVTAAGGIGLLLALTGIYAIMAFTVSRRTREIGVRVALGADRSRLLAAIFSRATTQVALGVLVGGVLAQGLFLLLSEGSFRPGGKELLLTAAYLAVMMGVCMLACLVPTRRALAIEPTEALRAED